MDINHINHAKIGSEKEKEKKKTLIGGDLLDLKVEYAIRKFEQKSSQK